NALSNLESLDLSSNQLTGEIPDLSALSNLRSLELSHNQLTGPIPNLSAPTSLTWLNLSHNQLNGTIFGINLLISLRTLYLSHNQLSGPLPDLGSLVSLWHLDLTGNRFCLPAGYAPSGANAVVTKNLTVNYSLPCTEAELEAIPGAPQNLAAATGAGQVTLTWDAVRDAAGYELWVWNSLDRKWEAAVGALTATTYTHSVLSDGRNYYYQVRARDAKGMRSPWSERVRAIIVPGRFPPPPVSLGLHLYYQKYLEVDKVVVVAPTEVSDETMEQARAIVSGMLSGKAGRLLENSSGKYIRISIYKRDEQGRHSSQVPEYLNRYPDAPGVAVPVPSGWVAITPQDDRRCGVFIHEFAHAIQFAIEDRPGGAEFGSRLEGLYAAALDAGLWEGHYAVFTVLEYWAETVRFWFEGRVPDSLVEGPTKLADYDPEIASLIAEVFGAASVPAACQVPLSEEQPSLLHP
ncbi:MAG: hypothetical protein F4Y42_10105, partial [Caldilineaceae bacterium SB0664_bin_27]|nr:hypothetical protein [Caldilineaceae bacterium SB0664_bin_27]